MIPLPDSPARALSLPNVLTLARVPLAGLLWVAPGNALYLFTLGVVAAVTDMLDGRVARALRARRLARGQRTGGLGEAQAVGAWLDPLSDKLFVIVPAVALTVQGDFPWWATAAIVLREVAVSLLRWRLDQRGVSLPASRAGKAKTFSQISAVGLSIAPLPSGFDPLVLAVIVIAVVLTVISGIEYLFTERYRMETG